MPTDYTLMDASLEILLMLLAAFLLGWLFCWILKKLFSKRDTTDTELEGIAAGGVSTSINEQASHTRERSGLSASSRERLYDPEHGLTKETVDIDTAIPTIETTELNTNGIDVEVDTDLDVTTNRPRIDIPDLNMPEPDLSGKLDAGIDLGKSGLNKGLGAAAAGLGGIAAGAAALKDKAVDNVSNIDLPDLDIKEKLDAGIDLGKDGLNKSMDAVSAGVGGITDKATAIKDKAIESTSGLELPNIDIKDKLETATELGKDGLNKGLDTASAGLGSITDKAAAIKDKAIEGVSDIDLPNIDIEGKLEAGAELGKSGLGKGLGAAAAGLGAITAGASALKNKAVDGVTSSVDAITTQTSSATEQVAEGLTPPDLPHIGDSQITKKEPSSSSDSDDLTRISGIDAQTASLLSNHGIKSFHDLESTDSDSLSKLLTSSGSSLEATSWPHQAKLCSNQEWDKLAEYQSFLSGTTASAVTPIVEEASLDKDDLKKIEGIGPFFESLLNKAEITTYAQLKECDRDSLKEIIDAAGPDYRLHEPETWPYQAGLADRGEWKKLQDYIHFMTGRG